MLDVSLDIKGVSDMLTGMEREVIPQATARTLNRVATKVQRRALQLISKDIGLPQKEIRNYFHIQRATWKNLDTSIQAFGERIPVHKLQARQTTKGVTYKRQGKRTTIPGAFLQEIRVSGAPGAYKRAGKERFPVNFLRTVSVPQVMIKDAVDRAMWAVAREEWGKQFPHEVEYYLRRAGYVA